MLLESIMLETPPAISPSVGKQFVFSVFLAMLSSLKHKSSIYSSSTDLVLDLIRHLGIEVK